MTDRPEKKQRTEGYVLYYWPGIPGRGEYIRLQLEHAGLPYAECAPPVAATVAAHIGDPARPDVGSPPHFAPPALRVPGARGLLSQTAAIVAHIAPACGLAGARGSRLATAAGVYARAREEASTVSQLVLTALDWQLEAHDTHHPVASALYYEDQKAEALRRAEDFRTTRVPKFFRHFQAVLESNPDTAGAEGAGKTYLVGKQTTAADLVLFHVVSGLEFAFPRRVAKAKASGKYALVFELVERVKGEKGIKEYLASERRRKFSMGIFRHYPELDGEEED
ncbi:glutathione S-transferase C-terminal-like protein [Epithele typhae]|uniref:glutathione S-transferase C-terminal-like protein n=1 Tax=Epithele typhae TaxID=378194 RepID=UPI002007C61A|nr:glutathione S-transferase C-terminal-like protein [Epithele typhae]KAH9941856.1 glutathione S-transferase C-terminal-like protein [Epithele typhae]